MGPLLFRLGLLIASLSAVFAVLRSTRPALAPLAIPVRGVTPEDLRNSFAESRDGGREHRAIDIPAPEGTAVLALAEGRVSRLSETDAGGRGLWLRDEKRRLCYYYGHLRDYAPGLEEGSFVARGELVAFVGSSGNAEGAHLHLSVHEVTRKGCSSEARVNPFEILAPTPDR